MLEMILQHQAMQAQQEQMQRAQEHMQKSMQLQQEQMQRQCKDMVESVLTTVSTMHAKSPDVSKDHESKGNNR